MFSTNTQINFPLIHLETFGNMLPEKESEVIIDYNGNFTKNHREEENE